MTKEVDDLLVALHTLRGQCIGAHQTVPGIIQVPVSDDHPRGTKLILLNASGMAELILNLVELIKTGDAAIERLAELEQRLARVAELNKLRSHYRVTREHRERALRMLGCSDQPFVGSQASQWLEDGTEVFEPPLFFTESILAAKLAAEECIIELRRKLALLLKDPDE